MGPKIPKIALFNVSENSENTADVSPFLYGVPSLFLYSGDDLNP